MESKVDPNQIFRKEQIFEETLQRVLEKSDWSTEEKIVHVRRLESRLNPFRKLDEEIQAAESTSLVFG